MDGWVHQLYGAPGSPYSIKMRAVLRYRRIPHVWRALTGAPNEAALFQRVKAPVIPILAFPDGTVMNDSTPLIHELERRFPGARSIVPADEAQAFLAALLEDFADEWGTKLMFLYRWARPRDQETVSRALSFDRLAGQGRDAIEAAARSFRDRQVGRMALVGCTPQNAPVIEASFERLITVLDAHVTQEPYLFGGRPSLADFGWLGQLSQLASDPTPGDSMRERAPYLVRWLTNLDDVGGVDGDWRDPQAPLSPGVSALLAMAGEIYLPFLAANATAIADGRDSFALDLPGGAYAQGVFKYQARCLRTLRDAHAALSPSARARVDAAAEAAGVGEALRLS